MNADQLIQYAETFDRDALIEKKKKIEHAKEMIMEAKR